MKNSEMHSRTNWKTWHQYTCNYVDLYWIVLCVSVLQTCSACGCVAEVACVCDVNIFSSVFITGSWIVMAAVLGCCRFGRKWNRRTRACLCVRWVPQSDVCGARWAILTSNISTMTLHLTRSDKWSDSQLVERETQWPPIDNIRAMMIVWRRWVE